MYRFFEGLVDPYQRYDDSVAPPSSIWLFYRSFLWPARWVLLGSIVFGFLTAVFDALLIRFSGQIIDLLDESSPSEVWSEHGTTFLWMAAVVFLLRPLGVCFERLLSGQGFFPNMGALVRWRTHRHVLRQSVGFFNDDFAGRIANKQIQLAPAFNDVVFQLLDAMWYAIIFVITSAVIMGDWNIQLLLPLGIWLLGYVACAIWFVPRITKQGKEVAEARSRLAGRIVDSYTNIQTVKLFAHAEREEAYGKFAIDDMRTHFQRQTRLVSSMVIVLTLLNAFLIGGVMAYAIWLWTGDLVTAGAVAATAGLVLRLQSMTDWIMWTLTMLFENIGVVMEGVQTVSEPLRLTDAPGAKALAVKAAAGPQPRIRYDGVTHHYGRDIKGGVEGISLDIAAGEKVGLVGRSGAGKSTLVNLLLRFFDPEKGRIVIDGQDVATVTQESLRAQIGMVTQDTSLLHRSILDNIVYGARDDFASPNAALEAAQAAARRVSAHEFIQELADRDGRTGYDAYVGERGVKLSGGQRQRIALARVVLKDAPILVLDEATSALDSEVEAAILEAMEGLMRGKTVIAIAHRLSTIAQMDRIVVMDQGRVIESGPHETLLANGGVYASLWARQSGGFLGDTAAAAASPRAAE